MGLIFNPADIKTYRASGDVDMGDLTTETASPRFTLASAATFHVVLFRCKFTGGTGSAVLLLRIDHWTKQDDYDFVLFEQAAAGTGGTDDISVWEPNNLAIGEPLFAGDAIVPTWTNPNTQRWAMEIGLIDGATVRTGT